MPSYVVTGAARGLGLEFVNQLSRSSENTVFGLVRNKKTASKLLALGKSNVHVLEADITDVKALKVAAQEVSEITGGTLDVLINNAAFVDNERNALTLDGYPEGSEKLLEQDLLKHFTVNVIGVIHTTNAFLPLLRSNSSNSSSSPNPSFIATTHDNTVSKKVITISSGAGDVPFTLSAGNAVIAPYSISKAALNLSVAKYAAEYKDQGILFLSVSPGMVATREFSDEPSPEELKKFKETVATFRRAYPDFTGPITPEESVKAILGVVENATIKDTGSFISHKGNQEWL